MSKTTIFYSGVENEFHFGIASKYADNLLMSYYYLQKKDEGFLAAKRQGTPRQFFIDSGAHTLQEEKGVEWGKAEWTAYLDRYTAWLRKNRDHIYAAVELDVANQVGTPIVEEWRRKYFLPLEMEGMQIIYVWHINQAQDWEKMCQQHRYLGLSHETFREEITERMMLTARRYRTKVHGFAITSHKAIRDYTLATADSTSWKAGERYGAINFWTGRKLQFVERKDRFKWKEHIVRLGYDFEKLMRDEPVEVSSLCIAEFRKMEEYYGAIKASRQDYWRIRTPYPEIVDNLPLASVQSWLDYLNADPELYMAEGRRAVLRAISLVQNGRLDEYLADAEKYNIWMSTLSGILVDIHDDVAFSRFRDHFNGTFTIAEGVRPRKMSDLRPLADKQPVERETDLLEESEGDAEIEAILKGYGHERKDQGSESSSETSEGDEEERPVQSDVGTFPRGRDEQV